MTSEPKIILDAHLDIAMNHVAFGRDFLLPAWETQRREGKLPGAKFDNIGVASVGLPNLLLGRTGIVFATLWVNPGDKHFASSLIYESPRHAYELALQQLDYYHRLADSDDRIRLIRTQAELDVVLESWQDGQDFADRKLGIVILMEGADPILEPKQFEEWYERGVRIVGPAWQATRYSAGTGEAGRLTSLGYGLLEVMSSFNAILDLSHLAEFAFYEAIDNYPGALLASHSNPHRFSPSDRQLTDDMIRRIAERDSVMGIVPFNEFCQENWKSARDHKHDVTVSTVLDMIDHVCQVTGSARHVGIGTDWDGGFGWESIPVPFDSHIDLWKMGEYLHKRGYATSDIHNILAGNFLRILRQGLPT